MNRFSWLATLGLIGAFTSDSFGQDAPPAAPPAQFENFPELDAQIRDAERINAVLRLERALRDRLSELQQERRLIAGSRTFPQLQGDLLDAQKTNEALRAKEPIHRRLRELQLENDRLSRSMEQPAGVLDPTSPSEKYLEFDTKLRNAEIVDDVLRENERLREMLKSNEELAARAAAAEQTQKDLTASVTQLLTELEQMKTRAEDLEGRLTDFSRIELQGLLISEEGSSTALLKVAGQPRFVQQGARVTLSAGADPKVSQTILVKEIRVDGVLVELAGDDRNPDSPAPTAFIQ